MYCIYENVRDGSMAKVGQVRAQVPRRKRLTIGVGVNTMNSVPLTASDRLALSGAGAPGAPCVRDSMKIITEGKNEKNRGDYQTVQTG